MTNIRQAIFAGSWYPGDAVVCEAEIESFIREFEGETVEQEAGKPVGGIVPHAGWYFSGSIACNVIRILGESTSADVVILFGMHLHPNTPPHLMPEGAWDTPFGPLPVQEALAAGLKERFNFRIESPEKFIRDNTIELQLPFVKYFYPDVSLLAVGVPPAPVSLDIARTTVEMAREMGLNPIIIGSTDLTHYGVNYGFAPKGSGEAALDWVKNENDRRFIEQMLAMRPQAVIDEALTHHNACCAGAAAAAVEASKAAGATRATSIAYATSSDKNPGDSFVGYVGMLFS